MKSTTIVRECLSASVIACSVFFAACAGQSGQQHTNQEHGSASPAPASASPEPATASASPAPAGESAAPVDLPPMPTGLHGPATPWSGMDAHAKGQYMHDVVLPAMQQLFAAYDAHTYEHVTCATCHGANARDVHFHMPNTLPSLFAFGSDQQHEQFARNPRLVAFMGQRLVPSMAQLLGTQPYDPSTHQGFGCFACHPHGT